MPLLRDLTLDRLTPSRLWGALDAPTRRAAAESVYRGGRNDDVTRLQADAGIAASLRFREVAVRRLPLERRIAHLARSVRPDDTLASSLLLALHLDKRKALLEAFLDALEIPHTAGAIDEAWDMRAPDAPALRRAVDSLHAAFPAEEVELYLTSLLAMEPQTWGGLADLLHRE